MNNTVKIKLIFTLYLLISFVDLFSQNIEQSTIVPVNESTGLITYRDVVQTEGNQTELYYRAIEWVNSFYANPSSATKVRNPNDGIIEIVHRFKISNEMEDGIQADAGTIMYSLKIELREGRYRYTMDNFVLQQTSRFPVERWLDKNDRAYNPTWDKYLMQLDEFAKDLIASLENGMKPPVIITDDEW